MGNIHIMSSELVSRIAAGEVVERPASVVKELVENSIDAGATTIRINVEQGGRKLIQVVDNGCGMDRTDAMMCLETHATSKLTISGDVGQISTLGFRGEALPSIAAVSRFILQTRREEDTVGTEVVVDYGQIRDARDCGCAPGTNIRVSQLFANLPARQKFMRGPETEDGYIEEIVRLLALARPDIAFALYTNTRETLRVNAVNNIGMRVASILGRENFAAMLPIDYTEDDVHVTGFITNPGYTRSSRREQRAIVNGRAASSDTIFFAIREAFDTLVMKGRYPGAVIYITLPPDRVDVNVHPTKREVRFRDQRQISLILGAALRKALRNMAGGQEISLNDLSQSPQQHTAQQPQAMPIQMPPAPPPVQPPHIPTPANIQMPLSMPTAPQPLPTPPAEATLPEPRPSGGRAALKCLKYRGLLSSHYALAESDNGLVVVNLKAAHQRIVFERLLQGLNAKSVPQQQLLIPITINLSVDDARFIRSEKQRFEQLGFSLEPFGGNAFLLTALPAAMPDNNMEQVIRDMIDDLRKSPITSRQNAVHLAQVACRHAIFAKDMVSDADATNIINDLIATEMPYACPNGHPTMVHITYAELAKRFSN